MHVFRVTKESLIRRVGSDGALYQVMLEYRFDSDSVRHTPYILL